MRLVAHLGITLSLVDSVSIKYQDPYGQEGSWAATVSDTLNGIVYKDLTVGSPLETPGVWTFWAYAEFSDGRVGIGKAFQKTIKEEGD